RHDRALLRRLRSFDVANAIGVTKHGLESGVGILWREVHERISEIRQAAQPWAVNLFDHLHEEKWVFGNAIVVLEMNDYVARGGILRDALQSVGCALEVGRLMVSRSDMRANAW